MLEYINQIKSAKSVDELECIAEKNCQEWARLSEQEFDILAGELSIAEEKIQTINAARMN